MFQSVELGIGNWEGQSQVEFARVEAFFLKHIDNCRMGDFQIKICVLGISD